MYAWRDEFSRARQPTPCRHWRIEVSAGGHRYSCCADKRGGEVGEREKEKEGNEVVRAGTAGGRERGKCAVGERRCGGGGGSGTAVEERKREGPLVQRESREVRGTDERLPGIIAAGVVRSGGHSITTQWRAYYVVSERV